jgi:hypothetical protein
MLTNTHATIQAAYVQAWSLGLSNNGKKILELGEEA